MFLRERRWRVGIAIYQKNHGEYTFAMELKKSESEDKIEETARAAHGQTKEKEYSERYKRRGTKS